MTWSKIQSRYRMSVIERAQSLLSLFIYSITRTSPCSLFSWSVKEYLGTSPWLEKILWSWHSLFAFPRTWLPVTSWSELLNFYFNARTSAPFLSCLLCLPPLLLSAIRVARYWDIHLRKGLWEAAFFESTAFPIPFNPFLPNSLLTMLFLPFLLNPFFFNLSQPTLFLPSLSNPFLPNQQFLLLSLKLLCQKSFEPFKAAISSSSKFSPSEI